LILDDHGLGILLGVTNHRLGITEAVLPLPPKTDEIATGDVVAPPTAIRVKIAGLVACTARQR
jgi:hypothetical protein